MPSSHSTQLATARAIAEVRQVMATEWAAWLVARTPSSHMPVELLERELLLSIDTLVEMLGPLRREAKLVWAQVNEHYGRSAAARGLAAGEVVDEVQQLRVLLIKHIGPMVAEMRPRRAVAVFLRLNRVIDRGITQAVIGYTDALVASLMMTDRTTQSLTQTSPDDIYRELATLETQLAEITAIR